MQQTTTQLDAIQLVGVKIRTTNQAEMNPETAKIGVLVEQYYASVMGQIPNCLDPNVSYSVYTEYENDMNGEYTCFLGQAVAHANDLPEGFSTITLPAQQYCKFTTNPGPFPDVVINAWQSIWTMNANDFGSERAYVADFELYDHRAKDPTAAVLDIYIGVNNT